MATNPELQVLIINPDKELYRGTATHVIAPSKRGNLGILPGHTPMFALITAGKVYIDATPPFEFELIQGILQVKDDTVTILVSPVE